MKLVYVPVVLPQGLGGPGFVESAQGWPEQIAGRVDLVERKLCVVAELVGTDDTGRDRVRFKNGVECLVHPGPERAYEPEPVVPGARVRPLEVQAA